MPKLNSSKKPKFFWQGVLILLPVALMASFGFWALLRQRDTVEQDARERAKEIVQLLAGDGFDRVTASRLTQFNVPKVGWFNYLRWALAGWPGDKTRQQYLDDTNELISITNDIAALKSAFPEWNEGAPPMVDFMLGTNGDSPELDIMPPRPPAWLSALTGEQRQAWTALETADNAGQPPSNLVALDEAFERTDPSKAARVCAEFIRLRAESRTHPATNAINELIRFASRNYDVESESGLPLTTLALAEALRRARECGPTAQLWEALRSEVVKPSAVTPNLLDEAATLAADSVELLKGIEAMRILLADEQSQQQLAAAVRQTGKLNGITTTNLWVNVMGRRWFCVLMPKTVQTGTIVSNHPVHTDAIYTGISCYPESLVERSFTEALRDVKITLPAYFRISVKLEGEPVLYHAGGDVVAEQQFHMRLPAIYLKYDANGGPAQEAPFESMPGQQFTLQIHLADRNLLYAKQRQLQLVFGALIALAALTALVGFVAALRSFHRQQELSELKTNFVSSVSHELRAPIASVRLMAENLERGKVPDAPRQNEYFRFIVQECRRLSSLIENVLDFSRIEQGRKQYEFEQTDLVGLTQKTVQLMEPYAAEKGVSLKLETTSEGIESNVDGRALQQALVNLIDNAIKHSAKGETVMAGIESKNGSIQLFVADHGPGIPRGEQEKIFERFYRLGTELRRETQGVGIGLSVVKHIVEAHGGRVIVKSEPGQGSRFTIELPARKSSWNAY